MIRDRRHLNGILNLKTALACAVLMIAGIPLAAPAQIRLGGMTITKPTPKPTPTIITTTTSPTATTSTQIGGRDPSRQEIQAFKTDAAPFKRGVQMLNNFEHSVNAWDPFESAAGQKTALDQAAAFEEMAKQKYPNLADPSWAQDWVDKPATWRRLAANRVEIVKSYISRRVGFAMASRAKALEKTRTEFQMKDGFVLPVNFDDAAAMRGELVKEYKPMFDQVGMTLPADSAFAEYDKVFAALLVDAKAHAADWKWDANAHDAAIEAKARGWMKGFDPKGAIVKIGLWDAAWVIDNVNGSIPKGRYRRGIIMYKKPDVEQCVVARFSFEQSYIGNGRYNAEEVTSGITHILRLQNCK